ncbi:MAG: hypothetical protein K8W52_29365 [Deltaproteobacteria bacterium]|nr:hypothetical protein [Deltaproteobacteria bacterium]
MSHARTHAAVEELRGRWEGEGFVRKGPRLLVRVVPHGLQIIDIHPPGTWRTAISVSFGVWVAAFEQRTSKTRVPWPKARYRVPAEPSWHAVIGIGELPGGPPHGYVDADIVDTVWRCWPAAARWLDEHADHAGLLAASQAFIATGVTTGSARHFRNAAMCLLELGRADELPALMEQQRVHCRQAGVGGIELRRGWWELASTWWHTVLGLDPPNLDGTPRTPDRPVAPPPVAPVPRDSIWYSADEWLKTRAPRAALDKVEALLALTTFECWDEVELRVEMEPAPGMRALIDALAMPDATGRPRCDALIGDDELRRHAIGVDPVLADALARFGPPRATRWAQLQGGDWRGDRSGFQWTQNACAISGDWFAFCDAHRALVVDGRPRVTLVARVRELSLRDPRTRAPLPFQGAAHCPPHDNTPSWPPDTAVRVYLPECRMGLDARLPFTRPDAAFHRFYDALAEALGYRLSPKHFRALLINKEGTRAYDRKLAL